ncbi:hypothetical protein KAR91_20525 [Candidatus Pacearchaeota archaeon]|nr:hypothetical protein [Candidatus Pacearchaeota archaeon]
MSKTLGISDDAGSTYSIFPGSSGDYQMEGEAISDSIYGQAFNSSLTGLISWTLSTNALYKAYAGYQATIKKSGTSTAMVGEPLELVTGKTYKTTATTKNIWDRATTFVVYDGASDVTDQVETWDYLYGRVTFLAAYTVIGAITVDGNYFPTSAYGVAREFTLTQNADTIDTTDFDTAQSNAGFRTFNPSVKSVSLSLSGFYNLANGFKDLLQGREEMIIEITPAGVATESSCRGFFKPMSTGQSGDHGGSEDESVDFQLSVPASNIVPFKWDHPSTTTIPAAIQKAIKAWEDELTYKYQYLDDGSIGQEGDAVITDLSLSSGLSAMNEFAVSLQGSGARVEVV